MQIRFNRINQGLQKLFTFLALCIAAGSPLIAQAPLTPQADTQAYTLPPDKLAQATALGYIRTSIHFGSEAWQLVFLLLLLSAGRASRLAGWSANKSTRPWLRAASSLPSWPRYSSAPSTCP